MTSEARTIEVVSTGHLTRLHVLLQSASGALAVGEIRRAASLLEQALDASLTLTRECLCDTVADSTSALGCPVHWPTGEDNDG